MAYFERNLRVFMLLNTCFSAIFHVIHDNYMTVEAFMIY